MTLRKCGAFAALPRSSIRLSAKIFLTITLEATMKSGLLMVLVVGLLSSAGAAEQAAGGDAEKLQGTWKVVSSEDSGQKAPDEAIKNLKMVITKEKITYKFDNKTMEWSYKLDPTKEPRWIDIKMGATAPHSGFMFWTRTT